MPRTGKHDDRTEQVPRGNRKTIKVEPLRPQVENLDKPYNNLAKFTSENPYPVMRIHKDGTMLYANKASEPLLKAKNSAVGKPAPQDWRRLAKEVLVSGCVAGAEAKDDGHVFTLRAVPVIESNYVNFYGIDITEQKTLEKNLEKERQELRLIIDSSPIIVFYKDKEGRFARVNKAFAESLDIPEEEFLGKTVFDIYSAKIAQSMADDDQEVFRTGRAKLNIVEQYESAKGPRWVQTDKVPIFDKDGILAGLVGFAQDITERKWAEQKIQEHQKRLKQLASQLTLVEEKERRRIAGEIHDGISQTLAMVKIKLDTLRNSLPSEASAAEIEKISSSVEKVIQETRTLTFELSNPILYELGFEAAVAEWLNEQVQIKHGIATEFFDDGQPKPIGDDVKVMLFRNVRELLTNCIKHAKAEIISINIHRINGSIQVTIEDNGVGFDPAQFRTTGKKPTFGLFSIRENMENTGGRFEIESKPGAGCKAIMTAPLKDQSHK
jgi:PAS domain S-box-containing protein